MPACKKNVITIANNEIISEATNNNTSVNDATVATVATDATDATVATDVNISNIMQTKAHKNSPVSTTKENKNKDDYCKELKNIAYKTMLLNGQEIVKL